MSDVFGQRIMKIHCIAFHTCEFNYQNSCVARQFSAINIGILCAAFRFIFLGAAFTHADCFDGRCMNALHIRKRSMSRRKYSLNSILNITTILIAADAPWETGQNLYISLIANRRVLSKLRIRPPMKKMLPRKKKVSNRNCRKHAIIMVGHSHVFSPTQYP